MGRTSISHGSRSLKTLLAALVLSYQLRFTLAAPRNVSIDDASPEIFYNGRWTRASDGTAGGHHVSTDPTASATFSFTGTAVYVTFPVYSYPVGTTLELDGGPPIAVDLEDHAWTGPEQEQATRQGMWLQVGGGLPNVEHTLRFTIGRNTPFALVDHITYTIEDDDDSVPPNPSQSPPSNPSSSTSASATSRPSKGSSSSSPSGLIIGAAFGGSLLLLFALLGIFCFFRRKRRNAKKPVGANFNIDGETTSPPSPPYAGLPETRAPPFGSYPATPSSGVTSMPPDTFSPFYQNNFVVSNPPPSNTISGFGADELGRSYMYTPRDQFTFPADSVGGSSGMTSYNTYHSHSNSHDALMASQDTSLSSRQYETRGRESPAAPSTLVNMLNNAHVSGAVLAAIAMTRNPPSGEGERKGTIDSLFPPSLVPGVSPSPMTRTQTPPHSQNSEFATLYPQPYYSSRAASASRDVVSSSSLNATLGGTEDKSGSGFHLNGTPPPEYELTVQDDQNSGAGRQVFGGSEKTRPL